ncbi:hypothetical protein PAHAL_8G116300 [Panicum hallii]|uniref:Uncharacterized protein n=1 Tax=Panicum hallii TaxID=206008 RepID=A0A2T8I8L5_9POAL|nr:hypothetical protein PAHAL_8G116300 [Panicum hallii]
MNCSYTIGHVKTGTPIAIVSRTEFHPHCVTNAPTAGCWSISVCGAQPMITMPLFPTRSFHPTGGSHVLTLTTHKNGTPDASSPRASSLS